MRPVRNGGDPEGHPGQRGAVSAQLDEDEGGPGMVGENELRVLIGIELDNALGVVDDIARTALFSHHIGACGEL